MRDGEGFDKERGMETRVMVPEGEPPATIREVVLALKAQKLAARHDKQTWGDWIVFEGKQTRKKKGTGRF